MKIEYNLTHTDKVELRANVKRGVNLLDALYPNWRKIIDTDKLNMAKANICVIGQLSKFSGFEKPNYISWSDFINDMLTIKLISHQGRKTYTDYGFALSLWEGEDCITAKYEYLTFLWLEELDAPLPNLDNRKDTMVVG